MKYVIGFLYNEAKTKILLQLKNRPEWQKGLWNVPGGKIEDGETPSKAIEREFQEETGLNHIWRYRGLMHGINNDGTTFECHIFYSYSDKIYDYKQIEDEILAIVDISHIQFFNTIPNLQFLVPYGICNDHSDFIQIDY